MNLKIDPYTELGLERSATLTEVKAAYRKLAKEWHHDLHPDRAEAKTRFQQINLAYEAIQVGEEEFPEEEERARPSPTDDECPETDYANLKNYWPFENFRTGQEATLEQLQKFLLDPKIKQIIMEAPTGSGKSCYTITIARASGAAYVSTANKLLQEQYQRDFKQYMVDLKGRANYVCREFKKPDGTPYNCSDSPCRKNRNSQAECSKKKACEYHDYLRAASAADITAFNFSSFLPFVNYVTQYFGRRNVTIVDEAHSLPEHITSFTELKFYRHEILSLGLGSDLPSYEAVAYYRTFIEEVRKQIVRMLGSEEERENMDQELAEDLETLLRKIKFFQRLIDAPNGENNFALFKEYDKKMPTLLTAVSFKPVVVSKVAHDFVFAHSEKTVLLSATILDFRTYIDMLGLRQDEVAVLRVGSNFPKQNRPIYTHQSVAPLNARNLDEQLPIILERLRSILEHYKDYKGIIHGGTYKICSYINDYLGSSRILFPRTARDQKEILAQHLRGSRPTVLLSPSMTEGVDLKDDASRFQCIVKLPYPYLGDPIVKLRQEIYPNYIEMQTALTLVQAYGRSVRSETDWSHTYILDGGFRGFVARCRYMLPEWFLEAIQ